MIERLTAEDLYKEVNGGRIVKFYGQTMKAIETQAGKIEQYDNSPYTENNADTLTATARALHILGEELRAWHKFLYPEGA